MAAKKKDAQMYIMIGAALALGHMAGEYVTSSPEEWQRFLDWEKESMKQHTDGCEHDHATDVALHALVADVIKTRDPERYKPLVQVLEEMTNGMI